MTPLRFHMRSEVGPLVNVEITGLDKPESPFLTITETCAACGHLIASTQFDTRDRIHLQAYATGERNAVRFTEHWERNHADA